MGSTQSARCRRDAQRGLDDLQEERTDRHVGTGRAVDRGELGVVPETAARPVECVDLVARDPECRLELVLLIDRDGVPDPDRVEGRRRDGHHDPPEWVRGAAFVGVGAACDAAIDGEAVPPPSSSRSRCRSRRRSCSRRPPRSTAGQQLRCRRPAIASRRRSASPSGRPHAPLRRGTPRWRRHRPRRALGSRAQIRRRCRSRSEDGGRLVRADRAPRSLSSVLLILDLLLVPASRITAGWRGPTATRPGPPGRVPGGPASTPRRSASLDAHDREVLADVHRDGGSVGVGHVGLVLGVSVRVCLDPDDRPARDLRLRRGLDLRRGVAGERRLVAALAAPRLTAAGPAVGRWRGRGGGQGSSRPTSSSPSPDRCSPRSRSRSSRRPGRRRSRRPAPPSGDGPRGWWTWMWPPFVDYASEAGVSRLSLGGLGTAWEAT